MSLHESGEDYLETILMLEQEKGMARSIDVAQHLGFSKPSVSRAVAILKAEGHLSVGREGYLKLTETGRKIAEEIYARHRFLTQWLIALGVPGEIAGADACRMEHVISAETFQCLKRHVQQDLQSEEKEL